MSQKPKRDLVNSALSSISQIIIYIKNPTADVAVAAAKDDKPLDEVKPNAEPLKLSMLDAPPTLNKSGLSEYPYIVESKYLPSDKLFGMLIADYADVLRFFFDKKYFITVLGADNLAQTDIQGDTTPQNILDYNVKLMISLLFPTYYPVARNHFNSYGHFITQSDSTIAVKGQVADALFLHKTYTYINLYGSKYTITRVVWLNDLYNNPVYRSLINEYSKFYMWLNEAKPQIIKDIKQYVLKLLKESNCNNLFTISGDGKCLSEGFKYNTTTGKYENTTNIECYSAFSKEISKLYASMVKRINTAAGSSRDKYLQKLDDLDEVYISVHNIETYIREKIEGTLAQFSDDKIQTTESADVEAERFLYGKKLDFLNSLYALKKAYDTSLKVSTSSNVSDRTIDYSAAIEECMKTIKETLGKISIAKRVYEKYLVPGKYVINESDKNMESEIKKKYETLSKFSQNVQSLKKRKSANPILQNAVSEFINGKSPIFSTVMENIQEALLYNKLIRQTLEPNINVSVLNTSVGRINADDKSKPQYEIFVGMDLIKGELNQENVKSVKCAYEGYYLGQQLSLWSLAANEVDFVVVDLAELEKRSKGPKGPDTGALPPADMGPSGPPVKKGGRKMTRKQFFAMKTHRKSMKTLKMN